MGKCIYILSKFVKNSSLASQHDINLEISIALGNLCIFCRKLLLTYTFSQLPNGFGPVTDGAVEHYLILIGVSHSVLHYTGRVLTQFLETSSMRKKLSWRTLNICCEIFLILCESSFRY